jgi:hypothetical protein
VQKPPSGAQMEHEKLQQNCPAPQWRLLHGSPASASAGGLATAAAVSNRAKRSDGRFLFTAVLLSVPVGVVPPFIRCWTPVAPGHGKETPAVPGAKQAVAGARQMKSGPISRRSSICEETGAVIRSGPAAPGDGNDSRIGALGRS